MHRFPLFPGSQSPADPRPADGRCVDGRSVRAVCAVMLCGVWWICCPAQASATDWHALHHLIGDDVFSRSAESVLERIERLAPEDQFRELAGWVLPSAAHPTLRMTVCFGPDDSDSEAPSSDVSRFFRSPAVQLVELATRLKRLDEVRDQVITAPEAHPHQRMARLSALVLVETAAGNHEPANEYLTEIYNLIGPQSDLPESWQGPLLIAVQAGARLPECRPLARDLGWNTCERIKRSLPTSQWQSFHANLEALIDSIPQQPEHPTDSAEAMPDSSQWVPGTLRTAATHGQGFPPDRWHLQPGSGRKSTGHAIDLLYYQSPLRGNFDVDMDASVNSWRGIELTFGGHWASTYHDRRQYRVGTLNSSSTSLLPLDTLMSVFRHEVHYRLEVRDQHLKIHANGTLLHSAKLDPDADPWLALRRTPKNNAQFWNVQISGKPDIPESVGLLHDGTLSSWINFYGTPDGSETGPWISRRSGDGTLILHGRHDDGIRHSYCEQLLSYHRPLPQYASIDYEFLYEANRTMVHPAIDCQAILLLPSGLKEHSITYGVFETTRSPVFPAVPDVPPERLPAPLPLKEGTWNRLRLTVRNGRAEVLLNGASVGQIAIRPDSSRQFGFFYCSDQTQALVRNVVMTGDWPRSLPPQHHQELVDVRIRQLQQSAEALPAVFRHDFSAAPPDLNRFAVVSGVAEDLIPDAGGLTMQRRGSGQYDRTTLAAQLEISGDFDIEASFDSFVTHPGPDGHSSASLRVHFADADKTQVNCRIRHNRFSNREDQHLIYSDLASFPGNQPRRTSSGLPDASTSGTLRTARRGNLLYTLFAEGDSGNFRITSVREVPTDAVGSNGLVLSAMAHLQSFVRVRWKHLSVRAEKLDGPALEDQSTWMTVADINARRDQLPVAGSTSYSTNGTDQSVFRQWGSIRPWRREDGGLVLECVGRESWKASGLSLRGILAGDFDLTARLRLLSIDNTPAGKRSEIHLKAAFDQGDTEASLIYQIQADGAKRVLGRTGNASADRSMNYQICGSRRMKDVVVLRMSRFGDQMTLFATDSSSKQEKHIATLKVSDGPIPDGALNFMVHSRGTGRKTSVVLESLTLRATGYQGPGTSPVTAPSSAKTPGLLDRILDFFD